MASDGVLWPVMLIILIRFLDPADLCSLKEHTLPLLQIHTNPRAETQVL